MFYKTAADIVVLLHFMWILFLVSGAFLGRRRKGVKVLHVLGMGFAVVIQVAGWYCPLTYLEVWLRQMHDPSRGYTGSFIVNYVQKLVYIDLPKSAIGIGTTILILVSAFIYLYPAKDPEKKHRKSQDNDKYEYQKPKSETNTKFK